MIYKEWQEVYQWTLEEGDIIRCVLTIHSEFCGRLSFSLPLYTRLGNGPVYM